MIQIYFLSIFLNVLAGYVLISGDNDEGVRAFPFLEDDTARLILGVFSMVVGFLKLLTPQGNIVILGDLIPAVAGFASGIILLIGYYKSKTTLSEEAETKPGLLSLLMLNKKFVGYVAMAAAILHFLFPRIIFL